MYLPTYRLSKEFNSKFRKYQVWQINEEVWRTWLKCECNNQNKFNNQNENAWLNVKSNGTEYRWKLFEIEDIFPEIMWKQI